MHRIFIIRTTFLVALAVQLRVRIAQRDNF